MRTSTPALLCAALAFGATMVSAQGEHEHAAVDPTITQHEMAPKFEDFDVNRDGTISEAEIPTKSELYALIDAFDYDRDGRLSRAEFNAWAGDEEIAAEQGL